ncbi:MAG: hypothetical protein H0V56_04050, partial [Chthoniobacterales bacterium]|nr:hypothetical protein [Chthoniobacterales bacterium]
MAIQPRFRAAVTATPQIGVSMPRLTSLLPQRVSLARRTAKNGDTTASLGFEAKLWAAADALRNNMDAAEYKHVVLGLIFS